MKLTFELPAKSEEDYEVAGLSREENKKFWLEENYVNYVWFRVFNFYVMVIGIIYCFQLFLVKLSTFCE